MKTNNQPNPRLIRGVTPRPAPFPIHSQRSPIIKFNHQFQLANSICDRLNFQWLYSSSIHLAIHVYSILNFTISIFLLKFKCALFSVALLLIDPPGHLHPASPAPLHHLQHPQGDHRHHDGYAGDV